MKKSAKTKGAAKLTAVPSAPGTPAPADAPPAPEVVALAQEEIATVRTLESKRSQARVVHSNATREWKQMERRLEREIDQNDEMYLQTVFQVMRAHGIDPRGPTPYKIDLVTGTLRRV